MAKFRKKPAVIEAEQWWPNAYVKGVKYAKEWIAEDADGERVIREDAYVITIHKQRCYLEPGDWILPESDGIHYYPCKSDIFNATYEPEVIANG